MLPWLPLALAGSVCEVAAPGDPGEVWVVSVAPGLDVASSWGHTELVLAGGGRGATAYSWGAYDSGADGAAWAFVRGRLPYLLVDLPWEAERWRILERGRQAVGQRLALAPSEVAAVFAAVDGAAAGPRAYAYDWRTRNCTTMARDLLDEALGGALSATLAGEGSVSVRQEIRRGFHRLPVHDVAWSYFAGPEVDVDLGPWEQTLFPERLADALDRSRRASGELWVAERCQAVDGPFGWSPPQPASTVGWAVPGGVLGGAALLGSARRAAGALVALWGTLLFALGGLTSSWWAVSEIRGAGPTWGWLLAGPSAAVLVAVGLRRLRGHDLDRPWRVALGGVVVVALGGSLGVAEGVALALLPGTLLCTLASWRPKGR